MISTAVVETERPERYLTQLCRHAQAMSGGHGPHAAMDVQIEQSDNRAVLRFVHWGHCVLEAGERALTVRVEAADVEGLRRIQEIVAADLARFGRREALALTWQGEPVP
jgi:hypothetical protein